MTPDYYTHDPLGALEAKERAQWIAYAPFVFQAAHCLKAFGILAAVEASREAGLDAAALRARCELSDYGLRVLLEAGLGIGLLTERDGRYRTTRTTHFLLHDRLTVANFDFTRDVNYLGLHRLDAALAGGRPAGLSVFGAWPTIYEALAKLPEPVRTSWFGFDHYYSDVAFPAVLPQVFRRAPRRLLDIGGNTGKWAIACTRHDPDVEVTLMDLPGQLADAQRAVARAGFAERVRYHEANLLDPATRVPEGFDAIWMSQFLDCFSDKEIVSILRRCAQALAPGARIYILEPFWDRQRFRAAAFCLQMTSLYFTALANGNSQMYRSDTFLELVARAGLEVEEQVDGLGVSHTLLVCVRAGAARRTAAATSPATSAPLRQPLPRLVPPDTRADAQSALAAKEHAQWIAFAPFAFQAARVLHTSGLLAAIEQAGGLTLAQAVGVGGLSHYAARVLLESGLALGLVIERDGRYQVTRTAHFFLHDRLTQVNVAYTHDVNYRGLAALEDSLRQGRPVGLESFGRWPTIYAALPELPEPVRRSWSDCVHYYSDLAFPAALPKVFERRPRRLLDVGGNTGKWAIACARHDPAVRVTIADLPGTLREARRAVAAAGLSDRIDFLEADALDPATALPAGYDAIWMSQFLFCFSEAQIVSVLERTRRALADGARLYILEPFWDRQSYALGAFCLQMTSLYFSALANGCSQMYRSSTFLDCLRRAGLVVEAQHDGLGVTQSLLVCRPEGA